MTLDDGDNARESPKFAYRWHRPTGRYAGTKLKASAARNSRSNVTLTDWFSTKASTKNSLSASKTEITKPRLRLGKFIRFFPTRTGSVIGNCAWMTNPARITFTWQITFPPLNFRSPFEKHCWLLSDRRSEKWRRCWSGIPGTGGQSTQSL